MASSKAITVPINATLEQRFVRCGNPRCKRCPDGAAHGPYWYAYWEEDGRTRTRYLGASAAGASKPFRFFGKTKAPKKALDGAALRLIAKFANGRTGLAFVPVIVRELGGAKVAHPVLERLAREERIELRPESGLGRINAEDLALGLPGPRKTRLSWVRRL